MKERSQMILKKDENQLLNDYSFNQSSLTKQIRKRYSKNDLCKENISSLNKIESETLLPRMQSNQRQIYEIDQIRSLQIQNRSSKLKFTENHSNSTANSSTKIQTESILKRVRSGDLDFQLRQKRKKLHDRRKEKMNFISNKLIKLNQINDQLTQLKGQIAVNNQSKKTPQTAHIPLYYLSRIFQHNYKGSIIQERKPVHFSHFQKNFLTLQFLQNQHHLVSRPPACQKVLNVKNLNIQPLPTLVLDLDETLVWTEKSDKLITKNAIYLKNNTGKQIRHEVHLRPFVKKFLEQVSNFYQIIIFTAGSSDYINQVIKFLDPQRQYISQVLNRNHAIKFKNFKFEFYVKDLRVLNKNLNRTVFVDNCIYSYALQLENGIPIIPFNGDPKDNELESLREYLLDLQNYSNIAQRNDEVFMQSQFRNYFNKKMDTKQILKSLYKNKLSTSDEFSNYA